MRAPGFWYPADNRHTGIAPHVLSPLALVYAFIGRLKRNMTVPERMSVPVICIGNFTAGGAGKTPTAIAISQRLVALGETPHFLTRGYGGRETGPVCVRSTQHTAPDVGDEPLLLSAHAPTWVSRDRVAGGLAAERAGASVIIMDDGFQNPTLFKDLSLMVVDTKVGIGNGLVLPAGPLREPMADALARTHGVVALGAPQSFSFLPDDMPVFPATLQPDDAVATRLKGASCYAFAGIGRPSKFFDTLSSLGATLVGMRAFDDHYAYSEEDIRQLRAEASACGGALVTTEKDAVRLRTLPGWRDIEDQLIVLPVRAVFSQWAELDTFLSAGLDQARAHYTYAPPGSDQDRTRVR